MAKDILLYGEIYEYSAMYFFDQIKEAQEDDLEAELILRINCCGGNPQYGMGIIRKVQEMPEMKIMVDGQASSMAFFLLCYVNEVDAIDTSQFVLHRATWGEWYEASAGFKGSLDEKIMIKTNKDLERALRARIDVAVLETLPQFKENDLTLKDIFSLESRVEVLLSTQDMKKLGLVKTVTKITPAKLEAIKKTTEAFRDCKSVEQFKLAAQTKPTKKEDEPIKNTIMDLAKLKAEYPALYAQVKAEGHTEGLTAGAAAEKDRVEAIMVFNEIDPATVKAAIESGKPLSQKQLAELQLKAFSNNTLNAVKKDSAGNVITEDPKEDPKTDAKKDDPKEKLKADFSAEVRKKMGLKEKAAA